MKKILNEWNKFILKEASQFRDIMRILSGDRQNVQSVGMMTPENPNAEQLPEEENDLLIKDFTKKIREMKKWSTNILKAIVHSKSAMWF